MLRHYDAMGLVSPGRRAGNGYRDYTDADIDRLFRVESLRSLGLPLQSIREALQDGDIPVALVDELMDRARDRIDRERRLVVRLTDVRASGASSWRDVLDVVALLQELDSPDPLRRTRVVLSADGPVPVTATVAALLAEDEANVAGALQWSVLRSIDAAVPHLVAAVRSDDTRARRRAMEVITAAARSDAAAVMPVLREAVTHPDPVVRDRAVVTLGGLGETEVVDHLVAKVVRGADDVEAAETLGHLAREHDITTDIVTAIERELVGVADPGARGRLVQALGELAGERVRMVLVGLVDDSVPAVALTAQYLLTVGSDG
ncbi:MerR family transcriptional regulator [Williamsia deligens]|uniref:MerR family transcriptional regulator n=2 Tax=Williamsia deligens TaxID=321325 RepID=A0ABW3G8U3_9NOCA